MAVHEVEAWILVDEDGNCVASDDIDHLTERYDECIGGAAGLSRRTVKITLKIDVASVVEMDGVAPPEGKPTLTVK